MLCCRETYEQLIVLGAGCGEYSHELDACEPSLRTATECEKFADGYVEGGREVSTDDSLIWCDGWLTFDESNVRDRCIC
jgi:hypothetical protein